MISQALRPLLDYDMVGTLFKKAASYIDIPSLFRVAGREGAYYGESWDEILRQNNSALGPELVVNGANLNIAGWEDASTFPGVVSVVNNSFALSGGSTSRLRQMIPTEIGKTYVWASYINGDIGSLRANAGTTGGGTDVLANQTPLGGLLLVTFVAKSTTTWINYFNSAVAAGFIKNISIKEITDWTKLVYFDDPNGTVPVFSALQAARGRGLLLDRSKGLVRGPELLAIQPTPPSGVTVSGQTVTFDGSQVNAAAIVLSPNLEVGKWYEIDATVTRTAGNYRIRQSGGSDSFVSATGRVCRKFIATNNTALQVQSDSDSNKFAGSIALSVRELPGNHMVQPTSTARGEISRRVSRLTNTSFTLGAVGAIPTDWIERGNVIGRIIEDAASPSGKAMRITVSVGGGIASTSDIRVAASDLVSGASITVRILAKTVSGTANLGWAAALSTGLIPLTTVYEWKEVTFVASSTANGLFLGASGVGVFDVAAVDMRLTADAIPSIPSYQAVRSATDYDEVGFPAYWRGQTDDWAKARINPNGATKVLVMTAMQKMSDAVLGVILESSIASAASEHGTIAVFAPHTNTTPTAMFRSRGSLPRDALVSNIPAPGRLVITGQGDINADRVTLVVNNSSTTLTDDQGTGAFLEYDVFFGARAGTTLFANYREYVPPLIIFCQTDDPGPSVAQIKRLQRKFAKAIGVVA
jgi:hypothetical protein